MAQPAPEPAPLPSSIARPAARRAASRGARPRFQGLDRTNCVLFPLLFLGTCALARVPFTGGTALATLTVALLYALGWRVAGRACGATAALLLATSLPFAQTSAHAFFVMLAVSGSALLTLLWACLTTRGGRFAWLAAVAMLAGGLLAGGAWGQVTGPQFGVNSAPVRGLLAPGAAFLAWFWVPFLSEMGDKNKRGRWLPCLIWAALSVGAATVLHWNGAPLFLLTLPPACLLTAGGVSRLLPTLAGDVPALRYALATAAVLGLVLLRARSEWGF